MIQRIQSIFLALVALLSLLLISGSFLKFPENSASVLRVTFSGIVRDITGQGGQLIQTAYPYSVIIIFIPLISIISIFLYKNRGLQKLFVLVLISFILIFIIFSVYYYRLITVTYGAPLRPGVLIVVPFLSLIFSALAYIGIKKDDDMVKSYDRLR